MEELTKSLDALDELAKSYKAQEEENLSKARGDEDLSPDDVSDEAPAVDDGTEAPQDPEQDEQTEPSDGASEDDDEPTEDTVEDDDDVDTQKSLESELNGNESVKKALEVSEFLSEMVKGLDTIITDRTDNISKSMAEANETSNEMLAKSMIGLANGQKAVLESNVEVLKSIRSMNQRISAVEAQPTVRKSVSNAAHIPKVLEKSFDASSGDTVQKTQALTKSQASAKLTAAYEAGNSDLMNDILALEGTGNLDAVSEAGKQVLGI